MPGSHVSVNVNVNINIPLAPYHWVFLPERHFGRHDMDQVLYWAGWRTTGFTIAQV
ncbi:MAG: hypothetical protein MZV63_55785 [Marinilabiliales bacterium]|nr:hypothetical protein [Marinilabiliales bacterium]